MNLISCLSSPLVLCRQGEYGARWWQRAPAYEREMWLTQFSISAGPFPHATDPSFPNMGENRTSCRRKSNDASSKITTVDLDQLIYLCLLYSGKVLLRTTLHVISEGEMMYLQH